MAIAPHRSAPRAAEVFDRTEHLELEAYNFEHFRARHLAYDLKQTLLKRGPQPGALAPDFELPRVEGGTFRLSALRGKPVLLHFGSYT